MPAIARSLTALILAVVAGILSTAPAWGADSATRLVFFGDSLSDPGNFYIAFGQVSEPPYAPIPVAPYDVGGGHHFTDGRTWAERLAEELDTGASGLPALAHPGVYTNYAVGRARARANAPVFAAYDLGTQVGLFLADFGGRAPGNAVYVIWIGANDLDDALQALATDPSGATSVVIAQTALGAVAANVQTLYAAGARIFLIPNLPDLGETPAVRALGPAAVAAAAQLSGLYDAGLQQALAQLQALPQITLVQFDVEGLLQQVVSHPAAYGLTDVADACLRFFTTEDPICAQPRSYLFWDGIHPTVAGHRILESAAERLLEHALRPPGVN